MTTPQQTALITDIDGTYLRRQATIYWLRELAETYPKVREMLEALSPLLTRYRDREGDFPEYSRHLVQQFWHERRYVGIHQEHARAAGERVRKKYGKRIHVFTKGLLERGHARGMRLFAISGSPMHVIEPLLRDLHFAKVLGTTCAVDADGYFADLAYEATIDDKGAAVKALAETHNLNLRDSCAIGDTYQDIPMLQCVGCPIAFNPDEHLFATAEAYGIPIVLEVRGRAHVIMNGKYMNVATFLRHPYVPPALRDA